MEVRKRERGSVIFSPYYKIQVWDSSNLTWRDIQKRYQSKELALQDAPKDSKFRLMEVTMEGRTIL